MWVDDCVHIAVVEAMVLSELMKEEKLKKQIDMSGSAHPGMIKPGMVDVTKFELIEAAPIQDELDRHGLTIDEVLNVYPNVTKFRIVEWFKGSVGEAKNKPRHIEFIDDNGSGFTLLGRRPSAFDEVLDTVWAVTKIFDGVKFNGCTYTRFK